MLRRVFTQNIDTLETLAGLDPSRVVEAHGSFASAHCLTCRKAASTEHVLKSGVRKGEIVKCGEKGCSGLVKPDIVFFGEGLPDRFFKSLEVSPPREIARGASALNSLGFDDLRSPHCDWHLAAGPPVRLTTKLRPATRPSIAHQPRTRRTLLAPLFVQVATQSLAFCYARIADYTRQR